MYIYMHLSFVLRLGNSDSKQVNSDFKQAHKHAFMEACMHTTDTRSASVRRGSGGSSWVPQGVPWRFLGGSFGFFWCSLAVRRVCWEAPWALWGFGCMSEFPTTRSVRQLTSKLSFMHCPFQSMN